MWGELLMLTKYGLPQVVVFPAVTASVMIILAVLFQGYIWIIPVEALLLIVLVWIFSFFRDPRRDVAYDDSILYSPCDGTVTEVVSDDGSIKVSMFLSIYNVHINRSPCKAEVRKVTYTKGEFRNAKDPDSARLNEVNEVELAMTQRPGTTVFVRQISGAVARRIVCKVKSGDTLGQGQQFGMIKFGSRTELILSGGGSCEICVKPGDKVKAGLTAILRFI